MSAHTPAWLYHAKISSVYTTPPPGAKYTCGDLVFVFRDGYEPSEEDLNLILAAPELLAALQDMLSGWRYIRDMHGDLYGVGWDRAQDKAEAAIAKATEIQRAAK